MAYVTFLKKSIKIFVVYKYSLLQNQVYIPRVAVLYIKKLVCSIKLYKKDIYNIIGKINHSAKGSLILVINFIILNFVKPLLKFNLYKRP